MDIKALAQAEFAKIVAAHPNVVVTVVNGVHSTSGVRDTRAGAANLGDAGEVGSTSGIVRCNADTLGTLTNGQSITVGGSAAFVMAHRTDSAGALVTVEYTLQKPI